MTAIRFEWRTDMHTNAFSRALLRLSGLAMIVDPVAQMVAFAIHPQFWTFKRETDAAI